MKTLNMVCLCAVAACSLSAQIPAPTLYYSLDGSLPPVTGVMPVSGAGVFGPGQSGFGLSAVNPANALRAPDTYHFGAEPGTSDWTLSFWARFTWGSSATMDNFRLFSKGGRNDNAAEAPGFQLYCRNDNSFTAFFATRTATTRERIDANNVFTKFRNGQWNHFAFVRAGDAFLIYLNGEYIAKKQPITGGVLGDYGVGPTTSYRNTQLAPEASKIPDWGLDDVATWMSALSAAQILDIYNQGTNGIPLSGLTDVHPFITRQNGAWENAATWGALPATDGIALVHHAVTASSALPALFNLAIENNGGLTLGSGSSLALAWTGTDTLRVGHRSAGALSVTDSASLSVAGLASIGAEAGGDGALTLDDAIFNTAEIWVGDNGGRGALSLTDATLNVSERLVAARMTGSYAEMTFTRSSLIKTTHGGSHLHVCEGGASTGVVTLTDSQISYTRSAGTANRGILFANDPNGVCAVTNVNSVIELVTTNGTYMQMAGGANSRVIYHQQGAGARLTSQAELVIGYGSGSVTEFRQLDGAVESAGALRLAENAGATVDYWLSGGTFSPQRLLGGSGDNGRLHFDGGTYLVPPGASPVAVSGNVQLLFTAGKQARFDTAGSDLAFLQFHPPQGGGGLTKLGAGTLRVAGTYTGPTVVEAGTLALFNAAASTDYTVAEGASLRFEGLTNPAPATASVLTLNGTLVFSSDPSGLSLPRLNLIGAAVTLGAQAAIAFPAGIALLPGKSYPFLETGNASLGALAQNAVNIPIGWMVTQNGSLYTLEEITPSVPPLPGRDDLVVWLSRETIDALPPDTLVSQVGSFAGTGLAVSNAPRNDLLAEVQALYFDGTPSQAMHGPSAPEGIVSNNTWAAAMWVWSGNRANHEPTVVCWGMRKGLNRQNCSLNHASTESRAASFFGLDPKYSSGAPALDSWQHIVFSYDGATTGQGLTVYVNGEQRQLDLHVNTLIIPHDGQTILLGNQHNSSPYGVESRPYEGFLGELMLFDNTLTQAEAALLYTNGMPTYVGAAALPDADQVFESLVHDNWTDADGWRNGHVPYNNSALVSGAGVAAAVDSAVPSFKNLRVDQGAALTVEGVSFRPDGAVAVSNGAALRINSGGLLDPAGQVYLGNGGTLDVAGTGSKLFVQAINNSVRVGNNTLTPSLLNVADGAEMEVRNSTLQVSYNSDAAPGHGTLALSNATLKVGSTTIGGSLIVGHQSGEGLLTAYDSVITMVNGNVHVASSWNNGTAHAGMILDNTVLTISGGLRFGYCENEMYYRSLNVASPIHIRNKSSVTVNSEFILGNRNAASDFNQAMTPNVPSVMVLDDATLTLNNWGSVARQNGLGTLIITNNAQVIKKGQNHFRIGTDGNAAAGQGANTNPFTEGRVIVSAGGLLDVQASTNELRIATAAADNGILTISEGGLVKAFTVTGAGTRGALEFDGGTLQARASTNAFITCAVPLTVNAGKQARLDTQAFDIAIPRPFGGPGGLHKLGSGSLTLAALSTNTGPVTVEAGTLIIPDGCGVGGLLAIPAAGASVQLGTLQAADTVTVGGLHLQGDLTLELLAPGVCDRVVFSAATGVTAEQDARLLLGFEAEQERSLFGDPSVKYTLAHAPAELAAPPVFANLPAGWFVAVRADPEGGVNYVLSGKLGSLLFLK